jgi:hypothetical protein
VQIAKDGRLCDINERGAMRDIVSVRNRRARKQRTSKLTVGSPSRIVGMNGRLVDRHLHLIIATVKKGRLVEKDDLGPSALWWKIK